jgi:hypothetical protein
MVSLRRPLGLTSGAVTTLIDRLARAGWVERTPNPPDRRSVLVALSGSAEARGRALLGAYEREIEATLASLSRRDGAVVDGFLTRVAEIADSHADRIWGAVANPPAATDRSEPLAGRGAARMSGRKIRGTEASRPADTVTAAIGSGSSAPRSLGDRS